MKGLRDRYSQPFAFPFLPFIWSLLMSVKPIPEGYHSVTPYIIVRGAAKALDFYTTAFEAVELFRMPGPDGAIMHAEIKIGDSPLMIADEFPDMGAKSPEAYGGSPVGLMIYVEEVDRIFQKAVDNGAKVDRPIKNQFYGDRSGTVIDPFGHKWTIATHIEDVPPEEMASRAEAAMKEQK
jgi:PhnB protein